MGGVGPTTLTIRDSVNRVTKYFSEDGRGVASFYSRLSKIKWPSSSVDDTVKFNYGSGIWGCVANDAQQWVCYTLRDSPVISVDIANTHWEYSYEQFYQNPPYQAGLDGVWKTHVKPPSGGEITGLYDIRRNFISYISGPAGTQNFDGLNRIGSEIDAEGRNFFYTYDDRGNMLTKTQVEKVSTASLVFEANFDSLCVNQITCNKPNWIKDPKGNQTDFTYDPTHGNILSETLPADANGIRPQRRYKYIQRVAIIKNSSGSFEGTGTPIWKLSTVSYCRKGRASANGCELANDQIVITYDYGPEAGPNNLLLRGIVTSADGVNHRICYTYDHLGNKTSETTENAGLVGCY